MVTEQETLIYIEDKDKLDASVAANAFAHKETKNRAYINTLGAELALKYLASEDIDVSDIHNIHSIKKILEELDISDIILPNIHIDVRVVFDEKAIFIPKSHFEYNLVPDIYLVLYLAKDLSYVKFLGFFEPKLINKNNANDKYYFIEKEKLNSAKDLKKYIETHSRNTNENLTEEDVSNSERIIIAMSDNDISEDDKKYLINQLTKSAELRDKFIEYENFETLSYKAMTDSEVKKPEIKDNTETSQNEIVDATAEDIPTDVNDELEINDMELEPVESFEEISLDDFTDDESETPIEDTTKDDTKSSNIIADVAGSAIAGAAAGAIAGAAAGAAAMAAGEISSATSAVSGISAAAEAGIDLASAGFDVAEKLINNTEEKQISFDNVDVPTTKDITQTTENIEQEKISFDDIELSKDENQSDYIDTIDNKISFDNIEELAQPENDTIIEPLNSDNDNISLDDIDTSTIEPLNEDTTLKEPTVSFDNIDVENLDTLPQQTENIDTETLSLDNLDTIELNEADNISLDGIENPVNIEESALNDNTIDEIEPLQETTDETLEPEIIENETSDSFGKNLLENLTPENLDNVSIEDLDLGDEDTSETNAEDISSTELLSQIDDVLNSSNIAETPVSVDETAPSSLDEVPEIEDLADNSLGETDLASDSELPETVLPDKENEDNEPTDSIDVEGIADIAENENNDTTEETNNNDENAEIDSTIADISELLGDASSAETDFEQETENNTETTQNEDGENQSIDVLFNDSEQTSDAELDNLEDLSDSNIPGGALMKEKAKTNKNTILIAAALVTVLAAASAITFLKPKNDSSSDIIDPIAPKTSPAPDNTVSDNSDTENILATNAPDIKKDALANVQKTQTKELKSTTTRPKQGARESYMEVSKLVWDVPDSLSYSPKMQNYLRTTGKSIKLSLSADLLLADEYAYTNQVKVSLKLSKDGTIQDSKIVSSSGSTQIDKIVLQSVKDTLSAVKPPSDEIKTPDFNLALIIYF